MRFISNFSKMGRAAPLFADVTFGTDAGDKAAVIGRNGTGKSSQLAVLADADHTMAQVVGTEYACVQARL